MNNKIALLTTFVAGIIILGAGFASGSDLVPYSYTKSSAQVIGFNLPFNTSSYEVSAKVAGCGKDYFSTAIVPEDKRFEVTLNREGSFIIKVNYSGVEVLKSDTSRKIVMKIEYPVVVGKIFFYPWIKMNLSNGNVGYIFMVYPQFNYVPPAHIDAEMTFGDIATSISFNCTQNMLQIQGYCTTNVVELPAYEYQWQIMGDTYTCFTSEETQSCRIIRYN